MTTTEKAAPVLGRPGPAHEPSGADLVSGAQRWVGRVLSTLAVVFLLFDAVGKVARARPAVEGTVQLGYPESTVVGIGLILLACVVLHVIPRTAALGAILLTGAISAAPSPRTCGWSTRSSAIRSSRSTWACSSGWGRRCGMRRCAVSSSGRAADRRARPTGRGGAVPGQGADRGQGADSSIRARWGRRTRVPDGAIRATFGRHPVGSPGGKARQGDCRGRPVVRC